MLLKCWKWKKIHCLKSSSKPSQEKKCPGLQGLGPMKPLNSTNHLHNGPDFRFSFSLSHYQRRITGCFSTLRKQNKQVNRKQLLSFTLFLCNVFPHCFSLAYLPANPTGWQTK